MIYIATVIFKTVEQNYVYFNVQMNGHSRARCILFMYNSRGNNLKGFDINKDNYRSYNRFMQNYYQSIMSIPNPITHTTLKRCFNVHLTSITFK